MAGKVTFLHRRLWRDFLTVAIAREDWQLQGLRPNATRLLAEVEKKGVVRLDRAERREGDREAARVIEARLLVYSEEFHTDKGFHSKMLMTWPMCPKLKGRHLIGTDPSVSREALLHVIDHVNGKFNGRGKLPWRQ